MWANILGITEWATRYNLQYYYSTFIFTPLVPSFSSYLIYMGVVIGLFIFFLSYTRFIHSFKWASFFFLFFLLVVYFLTITSHLIVFFLLYELLFVPSFLLVYFTSMNRRGIFASMYFFFWTQGGSLLFLIGISYLYVVSGATHFNLLSSNYNTLSTFELNIFGFFILLGLGVKIPVWPFYYWLTKTHVEAPSFFSIYLSGFLVKTALYGLFLFYLSMPFFYTSYIFIGLVIFGICDSTMKMWAQSDLKKLVAYGTVQEMNLITLLFLLSGSYSVKLGVLFCLTHTVLSTLFFYTVEVLYRIYRTRNRGTLSGLGTLNPTLSVYLICSVVFYTGIPFTIKFFSEFGLLLFMTSFSWGITFLLVFILQIIGGVFWIKSWLEILYGQPTTNLSSLGSISFADQIVFNSMYFHLVLGGFFMIM